MQKKIKETSTLPNVLVVVFVVDRFFSLFLQLSLAKRKMNERKERRH